MRRMQTLGPAAAPVGRESRKQSRPGEHEVEDGLEARVDLCGNQVYGAFVLNRRFELHAIDATSARWRGGAGSPPLDGASTDTG